MITTKQHDELCDLVLAYPKSIVQLQNATQEQLVRAAYEFSHADRILFSYIYDLHTAALKIPVLEENPAPLACDDYNDGLRDGFNEAIEQVLKMSA
jgi:hypothetical protein